MAGLVQRRIDRTFLGILAEHALVTLHKTINVMEWCSPEGVPAFVGPSECCLLLLLWFLRVLRAQAPLLCRSHQFRP